MAKFKQCKLPGGESFETELTDSPGFEPGTSSLEGWRPIRARPRVLDIDMYYAERFFII